MGGGGKQSLKVVTMVKIAYRKRHPSIELASVPNITKKIYSSQEAGWGVSREKFTKRKY